MRIEIDSHAALRAKQRGATEEQIKTTIKQGEEYSAKDGRTGFRRNFHFAAEQNGKYFENVQLMVIAEKMPYGWLAITVITKFF